MEESKMEESKMEESKMEESKMEESKMEESKMEESKSEEVKLMETLQQKSKTDNPEKPELKLVDIEVTNENMALNLLVSFVHLAQRRGAFNMDEAAKIWECVKKFQKPAPM